jgi:hypothetical protein
MSVPKSFLKAMLMAAACWLGCRSLEAKPDEEAGPFPPIRPIKAAAPDSELEKLLKAKYNAILAETEAYYTQHRQGKELVNRTVLDAANRLLRAGLEVYHRPEEKLKLLKEMADLSKRLALLAETLQTGPEAQVLQRNRAYQFKLEVEIQTLRVKKADGGMK